MEKRSHLRVRAGRIESFSLENIENISTFIDGSDNGKNYSQRLGELARQLNCAPQQAEEIVQRFQKTRVFKRTAGCFASATDIESRGEIWDELKHLLPVPQATPDIQRQLDRLQDHGLMQGEIQEFLLAAYLSVLDEEAGEGEHAKLFRAAMVENLRALKVPEAKIQRAERDKVKLFLKVKQTDEAASRRSVGEQEPPEEMVQLVDLILTGDVHKIDQYRKGLIDDGWPEKKIDEMTDLAMLFQKIK